MKVLNARSLAATVDAVNEAHFLGRSIPRADRQRAAEWIAARQGLPGSYAGLFAPTKRDFEGIRLFTGERIATGAGVAHILGEEACRALILLGCPTAGARKALAAACANMARRLGRGDRRNGTYCCGKCSAALWRNLTVGGLTEQERMLRAGLRTLKKLRDGNGRWRVFPFYYTLSAVSEIDLPAARAERRYAAPTCERLLKRKPTGDRYDRRRRMVGERILAAC